MAHWRAQICNVARGEQVIDVDQEALIDDVRVGEEEGDRGAFAASLGVQSKQICFELLDAVCRAHRDLKDLMAAQEAGQPVNRLCMTKHPQ